METYYPDAATREDWARLARDERVGERAAFWRGLSPLPARPADGHKGTFGTALVVGGSRGMSGAVALAGAAALVSGAGLTRLAVPDAILETVAQFQREYTTIGLPGDEAGRISDSALETILTASRAATAVAVGPGMGRSEALDRLVVELFFELETPAVFDADALNALAASGVFAESGRTLRAGRFPKGERVFTPHPGEFARLSGSKPGRSRAERAEASTRWTKGFAAAFYGAESAATREDRRSAALLLKGAGTVITELSFPKFGGHKLTQTVNETGNANLATGGSGDALTGLIVGLMAQGCSCADAARIGAALHGLAAELRATIVSRGAVAGDVVRFLPAAFDYYSAARVSNRANS